MAISVSVNRIFDADIGVKNFKPTHPGLAYLVMARSPMSWERFRPGFVPFGRFWPELRAI